MERALRIGFSEKDTGKGTWKVFADEPWWSLVDLRDILTIFHPLSISATGKAAGASRTVNIPPDWKAPFVLRFYCADDYFADPLKHKPGQAGTESFFEHRYKQVLIGKRVVWERDVIDENTHGSQTVFTVDITPYVEPARAFTLTFRAFDKVTTLERNAKDVWFIGGTWYSGQVPATEQEPRFHTAVWFADPVVGEEASVLAAPSGERPHVAAVVERHAARWPVPLRGEGSAPIELSLVSPATIPAPGFPLSCGIPVPPGLVTDPGAVRLLGPDGELAVQCRTMGSWPDGSIRWLHFQSIVPSGAANGSRFKILLNEGSGKAPERAVAVEAVGATFDLDTHALVARGSSDPEVLLGSVTPAGGAAPALLDLRLRMAIRRDGKTVSVFSRRTSVAVVESGPLRACVELHGTLSTGKVAIGRFVFRLYGYAGIPSLQTQIRVFNDTKPEPYLGTIEDPPLEVVELTLTASCGEGAIGPVLLGTSSGELLSMQGDGVLLQEGPDRFRLDSSDGAMQRGARAQGWISVQGREWSLQASMWRFWQQYPKSLGLRAGKLEIGLFAPVESTPSYRPRYGEAKRHDVWLTFSPPSAESVAVALGRLADEPPRLFDGAWFCGTGAFTVLDPRWFERNPKIGAWVAKTYRGVSSADWPGHFGMRNFGDAPYNVGNGEWLNGYWAMVQGPLFWGLAGSDRRWIERGIEAARHIADVDAVHIAPGHEDWSAWDGLTCPLGIDHSVHGGRYNRWPAFQIGEQLILAAWMTGDPDLMAAGLANADYVARELPGLGSSGVREQARPMLTLLRAWQATGDARYRGAAERYFDLPFMKRELLDWRRGTYIMPMYENYRLVSAGLDSMYAHNVYEYYRQTGDLDAAELVVAIADSIYTESMLPQEEALGSFIYYPRYSRTSDYFPQMAMLFLMAYDLTEDARFLRAARAATARYLLHGGATPSFQVVHNFGWIDPELGGWLQAYEAVPTEPFAISSEVPTPDPANFQ